MKLEGTFTTFPLRELIEMTVYSSVTGVLNIFWQSGDGHIYFRDGQPYHAFADASGHAVSGLEAVGTFFGQANARFAFVSDTQSDEESLWGDPLDLVDNAERLAARWRTIRKLVPGLHMVPVRRAGSDDRYAISPEHRPIYEALDGQHTLEDLARVLNLEPIELCEAVAQIIDVGLVELQHANPVLARNEIPAMLPRTGVRAGVLERLLASIPAMTSPPPSSRATVPAGSLPAEGGKQRPAEEDAILRVLRG